MVDQSGSVRLALEAVVVPRTAHEVRVSVVLLRFKRRRRFNRTCIRIYKNSIKEGLGWSVCDRLTSHQVRVSAD